MLYELPGPSAPLRALTGPRTLPWGCALYMEKGRLALVNRRKDFAMVAGGLQRDMRRNPFLVISAFRLSRSYDTEGRPERVEVEIAGRGAFPIIANRSTDRGRW